MSLIFCYSLTCENDNGRYDHVCTNIQTGVKCSCNDGYQLENQQSCSLFDVDQIRYSSSLTLHTHVKTRVLSPAFCMELLNISRVFNFYSQFWRARAFFSKNVRACMNTHFTSTLKTARVHSHTRDTSRVYFVMYLACTLDIGMHGR